MARCPNCASEVEDGAGTCAWCGQPVAIAWWATKTALAGEPLFGGLAEEERPASASG
ncbi:MAG TPA: zinc-ribbon domain-containing protein [Thermoanaerobaculia bacterium]|jgi:hypothetical protein